MIQHLFLTIQVNISPFTQRIYRWIYLGQQWILVILSFFNNIKMEYETAKKNNRIYTRLNYTQSNSNNKCIRNKMIWLN